MAPAATPAISDFVGQLRPLQPVCPPMPEQDVRFIPPEQRTPPRPPRPPIKCHNFGGPHPWCRCRRPLRQFCNLCRTRGVTKRSCSNDNCVAIRELDHAVGRSASQLFLDLRPRTDLVVPDIVPRSSGRTSLASIADQGLSSQGTQDPRPPTDDRHLLDTSVPGSEVLPDPIVLQAPDQDARDPAVQNDSSSDDILQLFD